MICEKHDQKLAIVHVFTQFILIISSMRLEYTGLVWTKKSHKKLSNIHKDFEIYQVFMHNFLRQVVPIFPLYILFIYYPNYLLLYQPNIVSLPTPNLFIFDIAYTTHINLISPSNLNYKKVLKCVGTTNFVHPNLN